MIVAYRLFRKAPHKQPEVLFHALNGTKILPLNAWIDAEIKHVYNPGKSTGPGYISGFHVGLDEHEVINYLSRFKEPEKLVVCKVYVNIVRPKPNSKANIYLSERMFISSDDWYTVIGDNYGKGD